MTYERYMEKVQIVMWRDNSIYRTKSLGTGWFSEDIINANLPAKTNIMYVAANDEFANNNMTIRRAKGNEN